MIVNIQIYTHQYRTCVHCSHFQCLLQNKNIAQHRIVWIGGGGRKKANGNTIEDIIQN